VNEFRGKRVLVTGSTDGIGFSTAGKLSALGAHVVVHGRDPERVQRASARVPRSESLVADLSSLGAVRRLVEKLKESPPLALLINNAGVGAGPSRGSRRTSADGFELCWAVNFLAPFALTEWLVLDRASPRAVVNVASLGLEDIDFDDPQTTRGYDGLVAYRRSKLAMIAWTFDLAERFPLMRINAVHPGTFLGSKMVQEMGVATQGTVESGAEAVVDVARRTLGGDGHGAFFDQKHEAHAREQAYDPQVRRRLRRLAQDQVRQAAVA